MRRMSFLLAASALLATAATAQTLALKNARVMTATEAGTLEGVTVLLDGDKIIAVGVDVDIPEAAQVSDMTGKTLTPGFIVASTTLGTVEINDRANANDIDARSGSLTAAADIQYAVNPNSSLLPVARADGVGRAIVTPGLSAGTGSVVAFGGQAALITTSENGAVVSKAQVAVTLNLLGSDQGRAAIFPQLKMMLADAASYADAPSADRVPSFRGAKWSQADLEALTPVMRGQVPLVVAVERASDISALLDITDQHDLRVVLVGAAEAWTLADRIASSGASVILDPYENLPQNFDAVLANATGFNTLHSAGVPVMLVPPRAGHDARLVRSRAGVAAAAGLPVDVALRAITSTPANVFGLAEYGEIAPGKTADIAVWSGDPLEPLSVLESFYISGELQSLETRQSSLREKYSSGPTGE